ncbi:hypothetical protein E2C01_095960 [Portunus trituberculatus]|uniref:Uncharacterized protein n=1 Tax=Portunus trituberculatus TaxID=210409 RepID=A0A5B7K1S7_PORTR|nr:hypothetical protein [Portunus trituberculatus]
MKINSFCFHIKGRRQGLLLYQIHLLRLQVIPLFHHCHSHTPSLPSTAVTTPQPLSIAKATLHHSPTSTTTTTPHTPYCHHDALSRPTATTTPSTSHCHHHVPA